MNAFGIRNNEKTAVFIDGPNIYRAAKALNVDINYKAIHSYFSENSQLLRAFYYSSILESLEDDHSSIRPLIDWLDYNGFTVVTKVSREFMDRDGRTKIKGASMTVELAIDAMKMAQKVDHIVLFSGDGEYTPLLYALKEEGIRTTVVSTLLSEMPVISDELRRMADSFVELRSVEQIVARAPAARNN